MQCAATEHAQSERYVTPNTEGIRLMQPAVFNHLPHDDDVVRSWESM